MIKSTTWAASLLTVFMISLNVWAQTVSPPESVAGNGPAVTISVTEGGVRFVGLGSLRQMRLEVFSGDGQTIYNSEFHNGNVRDWSLQDKAGQRVADGTYLCVITIRDLSGKLVTKQGSVLLQNGQASLQMDAAAAGNVEPEKALMPVADSANAAVALIGHDGRDAQVVSTRGGFSFRIGDFFSGNDKEQMRLTEEGNLGIGTSEPKAKLDVAGTVRARQGFVFNDGSTLNVNDKGVLTRTSADGTNTVATTSQNRIAKFSDNAGTVTDSLLNENGNLIELRATSGTGVNPTFTNPNTIPGFAQFQFYPATGPNANMSFAAIPRGTGTVNNLAQLSVFGTDFIADSTNYEFAALRARGTDFVFGTGHSGSGLNRPFMLAAGFISDNLTNNGQLYLDTNGNVGVGTTSPQSLLDVSGNLRVTGNATVSGNIAAKYQDIAEWTAARGEVSAGTVVSLDVERINSVRASHQAYDTRVAGVVSVKPGVILGEGGPNRALVATTGRVKVKVNADRAPIQIGDLLVTSNIPGVAMKSQPLRMHGRLMHRPGTIIGKALEPLAKGHGEILVLLSLQ